jgi:peptide chain release factor 1
MNLKEARAIITRFRSRFDEESPTSLIVELKFGEGGADSKAFVDEMTSVYLLYAAKKNLETEILSSKDGNISIQISGKNVWEAFKNEIGKHQVQRIPPNERNGRAHTSIIVVGVYKLFEFEDKPLNESDLEIQTQRGSGPGGQHRNKTDSAVRMKHIPTGITVFIDGRDQAQNKSKALQILTGRVNGYYYELARAAYSSEKKEQMGDSGRTGKVRTYNFKTSLVHDHRLDKKTYNIKEIMKGNLDLILK